MKNSSYLCIPFMQGGLLLSLIVKLSDLLWQGPMVVILFGTHLYFSVKTGFIQKYIFRGIGLSLKGGHSGSYSNFNVISTLLASTVGTGSILGVAAAVVSGGPGAVFWCFMCGLLGFATSFSENSLAQHFNYRDQSGATHSGAMYWLKYRLNCPVMAKIFSIGLVLAGLGIGCSVQSNAMYESSFANINRYLVGAIFALIVFISVRGGMRSITSVCTGIVLPLTCLYLVCCAALLFLFKDALADSIALIIRSAFSLKPMLWGSGTYSVIAAMRYGLSRGLFSNESGLGSAPLIASNTNTGSSRDRALSASSSVFWDTLVICTITGVVLVAGSLYTGNHFDHADDLLLNTFYQLGDLGAIACMLCLTIFSYLTVIGWYCFAEEGVFFLTGQTNSIWFSMLWSAAAFLGIVSPMNFLWKISDLLNVFVMLPNLYCLYKLRDHI